MNPAGLIREDTFGPIERAITDLAVHLSRFAVYALRLTRQQHLPTVS